MKTLPEKAHTVACFDYINSAAAVSAARCLTDVRHETTGACV